MSAARKTVEYFDADHEKQTDEQLLRRIENPFTPLHMWVATFEAKLSNLSVTIVDALKKMTLSGVPNTNGGMVLAINSNFGQVAAPGFESRLKVIPPPEAEAAEEGAAVHVAGGRRKRGLHRRALRKRQGNGTCFNSAVEPIIRIESDSAKIDPKKVYFVKCFPTTGETQVPGTLRTDFSDGQTVLRTWVDYLNAMGLGTEAIDEEGKRFNRRIEILGAKPNMINSKTMLRRTSPRIILNLRAIGDYFHALEAGGEAKMPPGLVYVPPPFTVREVKLPTEDTRLAFRFVMNARRRTRVNIFGKGKINLLGSDSFVTSDSIYAYFILIFHANWDKFVRLIPRPDSRDAAASAGAVVRAKIFPPAVPARLLITDAELLYILDMYSDEIALPIRIPERFFAAAKNAPRVAMAAFEAPAREAPDDVAMTAFEPPAREAPAVGAREAPAVGARGSIIGHLSETELESIFGLYDSVVDEAGGDDVE